MSMTFSELVSDDAHPELAEHCARALIYYFDRTTELTQRTNAMKEKESLLALSGYRHLIRSLTCALAGVCRRDLQFSERFGQVMIRPVERLGAMWRHTFQNLLIAILRDTLWRILPHCWWDFEITVCFVCRITSGAVRGQAQSLLDLSGDGSGNSRR
jgi:hypothetical protein